MKLARLLLAAAALTVPASVSAAWHQAKTRHFIIYSNEDPETLRAYADKLERFDNVVRKLRGMQDRPLGDSNKLTLYMVTDTDAIERLAGREGVGGFYNGSASGSVAFMPRIVGGRTGEIDKFKFTADQIFFHEYSHHLQLQEAQVALPGWMVEGFAEFYGYAQFRDDGSIVLGAPANTRSKALYADDLPIKTLLTGGQDLTMYSPLLFYGKSWLLTHYLAFSKEREGQLTKYIKAIQGGTKPLEAATSAFGDLKKLDAELWKYMRGTMPQMVLPANVATAGPIEVRPLNPGEAAMMAARMKSERGVNKNTAPAVAAEARRAGAAFANDPYVQGVIAEAEFDARNYDGAIAATDRALAIDPRNIQALVYKGRALAKLAEKDKSAPRFAEARTYFNKAIAIDPEAAEPLVELYRSYKTQKTDAPRLDVDGLLLAHKLVPQDDEVRLLVVRELLKRGRFADARQAYATLAFNPYLMGKAKTQADKVMAAIDARNAPAALAVFDEAEAEARKRSGE